MLKPIKINFESMKTRNFIIVAVLVFAVIFGGGFYSWALAAPSERELPEATVSLTAGEAWIKKGDADWQRIGSETEVSLGDEIKTGAESSAEINFFDQAVARLDEQTEVAVSDLEIDADNSAKQKVAVKVVAGRLWSRVMRFLDQDSSYRAETSEVVATVRGTAFVLDATNPGSPIVQVIESNVAVSSAEEGGAEELVGSGEEAVLSRAAATSSEAVALRPPMKILRRKIEERILNSRFFKDNENFDKEFSTGLNQREKEKIRRIAGALPGSPEYGLKRLGEKLRFSLSADTDRRDDLTLQYADRRFAEIATLEAEGRSQVAARLLPDFQKRYHEVLSRMKERKVSEEKIQTLCGRIKGRFLEQKLTARNLGRENLPEFVERLNNPPPELKVTPWQLRDELCASVKEIPNLKPLLPRVVPLEELQKDGATNSLRDILNKPLINADSNLKPPLTNSPTGSESPPLSVEKITVSGQKTTLNVSETEQLLATAIFSDKSSKAVTAAAAWSSSNPGVLTVDKGFVSAKSPGSATVTASLEGKSGNIVIQVTGGGVAAATVTKVTLTGQRSILYLPDTQQMRAVATYSDNSTKEVTDLANWSSSNPEIFTAVGGLVYTKFAGSANVIAEYSGVTGTFAIRVLNSPPTAPPKLEAVSVSCSPQTLDRYQGQTYSVCTATARYSDSSTKNVTSSANWSADATYGAMEGNYFYSSQMPGTAWVRASYSDDTGSAQGQTNVTIL